MDKIFEQAKDLHVVATIIYGNGSDTKAYADIACTKAFKASELAEVFVKGALINIKGALYHPVNFNTDTIGYVKADGSAATLKADADEVNE